MNLNLNEPESDTLLSLVDSVACRDDKAMVQA